MVRDIQNYDLDVCCLQETKIKEETETVIQGNTIITFSSICEHYGNGFVISKKLTNSIYKYWRVSDRICVLQIKIDLKHDTNPKYQAMRIDDMKVKIIKTKPSRVISIINVYAPTADRAKKHPNEINNICRSKKAM